MCFEGTPDVFQRGYERGILGIGHLLKGPHFRCQMLGVWYTAMALGLIERAELSN